MNYIILIFSIVFLFASELKAISEKRINVEWDETLSSFMKKNGIKGNFNGEKGIRINYFKV